MSSISLEERMAALEAEVAHLKQHLLRQPQGGAPWWERRFGAFKDDPAYEAAALLGAEYRRSQPTPADDGASA